MFTGIVEEMGEVLSVSLNQGVQRLHLHAQVVHENVTLGDSIAVNGVCLTVVAFDGHQLWFEAVPETLRRTNLGELEAGVKVNLERPIRDGRPMGGHYVQGHVDGKARLVSVKPDGDAKTLVFETEHQWMKYVVPKGYVCLDGTSLTVIETTATTFSLTLIPHTQNAVVFGQEAAGYVCNLEVDVMGKYVERIIGPIMNRFETRLAALESKQGK